MDRMGRDTRPTPWGGKRLAYLIEHALNELLLLLVATELLAHHLFSDGHRKFGHSLADVAQGVLLFRFYL